MPIITKPYNLYRIPSCFKASACFYSKPIKFLLCSSTSFSSDVHAGIIVKLRLYTKPPKENICLFPSVHLLYKKLPFFSLYSLFNFSFDSLSSVVILDLLISKASKDKKNERTQNSVFLEFNIYTLEANLLMYSLFSFYYM